jgi:hypothetical protein
VADEDLDIYPEGLGLAPLSLKTHVETPEEVATAVAGLAELIEEIPGQAGNEEEEPETEPVPEPVEGPVEEPVEEIPDQVGNDEEEPVGNDEEEQVAEEISPRAALGRNDKSRKFWRVVLIVLCVLVGLLLIFVLLNRLAPGLLDPLLYSKEELQILRY